MRRWRATFVMFPNEDYMNGTRAKLKRKNFDKNEIANNFDC